LLAGRPLRESDLREAAALLDDWSSVKQHGTCDSGFSVHKFERETCWRCISCDGCHFGPFVSNLDWNWSERRVADKEGIPTRQRPFTSDFTKTFDQTVQVIGIPPRNFVNQSQALAFSELRITNYWTPSNIDLYFKWTSRRRSGNPAPLNRAFSWTLSISFLVLLRWTFKCLSQLLKRTADVTFVSKKFVESKVWRKLTKVYAFDTPSLRPNPLSMSDRWIMYNSYSLLTWIALWIVFLLLHVTHICCIWSKFAIVPP
jgi:hypothetical protein